MTTRTDTPDARAIVLSAETGDRLRLNGTEVDVLGISKSKDFRAILVRADRSLAPVLLTAWFGSAARPQAMVPADPPSGRAAYFVALDSLEVVR